ncbi:unnamed protein product [Dibothriocephalus latus]|uniref:Uncharacterized protein n=1 Tax=Dibothriocephalus latus TaxID=60516 RepID=A0A3P7NQ76_DIBLA|nr:unnamed protein product [Dibothriocephalus latus]
MCMQSEDAVYLVNIYIALDVGGGGDVAYLHVTVGSSSKHTAIRSVLPVSPMLRSFLVLCDLKFARRISVSCPPVYLVHTHIDLLSKSAPPPPLNCPRPQGFAISGISLTLLLHQLSPAPRIWSYHSLVEDKFITPLLLSFGCRFRLSVTPDAMQEATLD